MEEPLTLLRKASARLPASGEDFQLVLYGTDSDDEEHLALVLGDVTTPEPVLARVHSECFTGDVLGSARCDCGEQLLKAIARIAAEGRGVLVYLRQEGRGIGLLAKLHAYNLQDEGYDTVEANLLLGHQADERDYSVAAAILNELGVQAIRLLTNNPSKIEGLLARGIEVADRIPLQGSVTAENEVYLQTKRMRMKHWLNLDGEPGVADGRSAKHFAP